jgi:hypothetical protein
MVAHALPALRLFNDSSDDSDTESECSCTSEILCDGTRGGYNRNSG